MPDADDTGAGPGSAPRRAGYVPVFRRGQAGINPHVTLDQKTGREIMATPLSLAPLNPGRIWESIQETAPDAAKLARNGLFVATQQHAAAQGFDILRTRTLQAMAKRGWTRLIVTSPTAGCGASFVASNLALSLARLPSCRTVLMDMDLRSPALAELFCQKDAGLLIEFLMGEQPLEGQFRRQGRNLALALNGEPVARASELIQDPEFAQALQSVSDHLQPDIVIMDTPPALPFDDVTALCDRADAVLLVTDGTRSNPEQIAACERLFEGRIPLLGVVLNRSQDRVLQRGAGNRA